MPIVITTMETTKRIITLKAARPFNDFSVINLTILAKEIPPISVYISFSVIGKNWYSSEKDKLVKATTNKAEATGRAARKFQRSDSRKDCLLLFTKSIKAMKRKRN